MNRDQVVFRPDDARDLADFDPAFTADDTSEEEAKARTQEMAASLAKYQDILMAHHTYGLLILFQAIDGAGKDATIKHVMASLDPQGCEVKMFKEPTEKELRHDYLWRTACALPARGQIGIFNRSYYEQVIADRVHPEKLAEQQLPVKIEGDALWSQRFRQINNFEQYLVENGIHVLKFYLNLSREEQRKRLLERIERPEKRWKFSMSDVEERDTWDESMEAYAAMVKHTSTEHARWHIIPADNRWFARSVVAAVINEKLQSLHTEYPCLSEEQEQEVARAREILEQKSGA